MARHGVRNQYESRLTLLSGSVAQVKLMKRKRVAKVGGESTDPNPRPPWWYP
jgi:hypothetical protein